MEGLLTVSAVSLGDSEIKYRLKNMRLTAVKYIGGLGTVLLSISSQGEGGLMCVDAVRSAFLLLFCFHYTQYTVHSTQRCGIITASFEMNAHHTFPFAHLSLLATTTHSLTHYTLATLL